METRIQSFVFVGFYGQRQSWSVSEAVGRSCPSKSAIFLVFFRALIDFFLRFIKNHFSESFEALPESPPRANKQEEKWISSMTLLEAAEITSSDNDRKSPSPASPRTPEPKFPFVPSFSLLTPSGQSTRSIGSSPSTKGSPLTPMQFIRRAELDSALLRPATPTKQPRGDNAHTPPLRLWRP